MWIHWDERSVKATTRSITTAPERPDLFEIELFNDKLAVRLLNLGATLWDVRPVEFEPAQPGLCLALPDAEDYFGNAAYFGVTAGPVANRIAGATFELEGRRYDLEANEGPNQLHGGPTGFSHRPWDSETVPDDDGATREVRFSLHRPDGEGGYPGNLAVTVGYRLHHNRLRYRWTASTDAPTPVSLTNHTYWNLAGGGTIADHVLSVPAGQIVEVDGASLPTGSLRDVDGTAFDLRAPTTLAAVIERLDGDGIDHCYVLDRSGPNAGTPIVLSHPPSGRTLEVTTTMPGVQVYTGQHLDGSDRFGGHHRHAGVCLETQHLPDAVNQPRFPSCILEPGQPVTHTTDYVFTL